MEKETKERISAYKEDILKTRAKGLGSSDAALVTSCAKSGSLTQTMELRLAQMLGLAPRPDIKTAAMALGDAVENRIYQDYADTVDGIVRSNPYYASERLEKQFGFAVFNHIDVEIEADDELVWVECKASVHTTDEVESRYAAQLAWHWMLLTEKAASMGKRARLFLAHYPTDGMQSHVTESGDEELDNYDAGKLVQREIKYSSIMAVTQDIFKGLGVVRDALKDFKYAPDEEIDESQLPEDTRQAISGISNLIQMVKEAEGKIAEFKERMLKAMEEGGLKSIKCQTFRISYVAPTTQTSLDQTALKREMPDIYNKYYNKTSAKKAYVQIK